MDWSDGIIAVVKQDCPTCVLVEPVLQQLSSGETPLTVYVQDHPSFPSNVSRVIDDCSLEHSYHLNIETVPTLIKIEAGCEVERAIGWVKEEWCELTGAETLGADLPDFRPGCGSLSVAPGMVEKLELRYGNVSFCSRRIVIAELEDDSEACFDRGWSDGLPVVPPTEERVYRMLKACRRDPAEILGAMPPDLVSCTVEKVAINAVMAGCKPEYFPVVLATVEAALDPAFGLHGLLATTFFSGPMVIVNGPVRESIGMNWKGNALGQGNRANATIGRALQLVVRNVGGGRPGGVDQATLGNPGKYTFCFAEDESTPWTTLAEQRGFTRDQSAVTVISADGVQPFVDQISREPEGLVRSMAASLRVVNNVKSAGAPDAIFVVSPEHGHVFDRAGWSKEQTTEALQRELQIPGEQLVRGAGGIPPGMSDSVKGMVLGKFRPEGLRLVRAGGEAGLFSAIIPGWPAIGEMGCDPVTKEVFV